MIMIRVFAQKTHKNLYSYSFIFLLFISNLSMFEKEIVIDGRGHLVGRLASKVAH